MRRFIAATRYLIFVPALGSFIAATVLIAYGSVEILHLVQESVSHGASGEGEKILALGFIEVIDSFLLATVFYIIALGLYELFVDDRLELPHWLSIHDLDDLKNKLTGVVILVMGVLFLGQVVTWDGHRDLLHYGAAIALVIAALTYFLSQQAKKKPSAESEQPH
jgi:uncharacterized membrane protein YqhA